MSNLNQSDSVSSQLLRERYEQFRSDFKLIEEEIGRLLVGQSQVIREVIIAMISGGHVLLEGVPGLGKTLLVRTLAEIIEGKFSRIQFTPDLMPADLTGTNIMNRAVDGNSYFEFQQGPVFCNLLLADEINRATPKTQAALLESMQEHSVTVGRTTHKLADLFFVLATQNPIEMEGTYPLPEAQLDRFFGKIIFPFPNLDELMQIINRTTTATCPKVKSTIPTSRIIEMGQLAREVPVADDVLRYAAELIMRTHPGAGVNHSETVKKYSASEKLVDKYVRYGASPRGAQALMLGAKTLAILDGRFNVAKEDLIAMTPMTLRHRIILTFEGEAENITTDEIIETIIRD
ncbi:MAG: MoxR family ATPase [Planctomycetaceae bacterium]|jgi:MoxR-like ATPase|nr:MoxR family ATPase [Planctomycetaceae bacterium]